MKILVNVQTIIAVRNAVTAVDAEVSTSFSSANSKVTALLSSGGGWSGSAATSFASAWRSAHTGETRVQSQLSSLATALTRLAHGLDEAITQADKANVEASSYHYIVRDDGSISHSLLSDLDPIADSHRLHVASMARSAGETFANAVNAAIGSIRKDVTYANIHLPAAGSVQRAHNIEVDPNSLVVVAITGLTPIEASRRACTDRLSGAKPSTDACVALPFHAGDIFGTLAEALDVLVSEFHDLASVYADLSARLSSAAGQYLNTDRLATGLASGAIVVGGGISLLAVATVPIDPGETHAYLTWCSANGWPPTQCVGWAAYRRYELTGQPMTDDHYHTGANMVSLSGQEVPYGTAAPGSMISLPPTPYSPAGHVVVVEKVLSMHPPTFQVSEMNVDFKGDSSAGFRNNTQVQLLTAKEGKWQITRSTGTTQPLTGLTFSAGL
jgi:uncharacterized protein YukE